MDLPKTIQKLYNNDLKKNVAYFHDSEYLATC